MAKFHREILSGQRKGGRGSNSRRKRTDNPNVFGSERKLHNLVCRTRRVAMVSTTIPSDILMSAYRHED